MWILSIHNMDLVDPKCVYYGSKMWILNVVPLYPFKGRGFTVLLWVCREPSPAYRETLILQSSCSVCVHTVQFKFWSVLEVSSVLYQYTSAEKSYS